MKNVGSMLWVNPSRGPQAQQTPRPGLYRERLAEVKRVCSQPLESSPQIEMMSQAHHLQSLLKIDPYIVQKPGNRSGQAIFIALVIRPLADLAGLYQTLVM